MLRYSRRRYLIRPTQRLKRPLPTSGESDSSASEKLLEELASLNRDLAVPGPRLGHRICVLVRFVFRMRSDAHRDYSAASSPARSFMTFDGPTYSSPL
jgi:hypothetical protein